MRLASSTFCHSVGLADGILVYQSGIDKKGCGVRKECGHGPVHNAARRQMVHDAFVLL